MSALGLRLQYFLSRVWRIVRWPIAVCALIYVAVFLYVLATTPARTKATVEAIHAQRLTMADVDGTNLPLEPDPALVDATVEGVDANENGIRDDVELAIFKKYPKDIKIRAAELQYAMELQNELKNVFNKETWKANAITENRGYQCIGETFPRTNLKTYLQVTASRSNEVEELVFNSLSREERREEIEKYSTSFSLSSGDFCDIDFN